MESVGFPNKLASSCFREKLVGTKNFVWGIKKGKNVSCRLHSYPFCRQFPHLSRIESQLRTIPVALKVSHSFPLTRWQVITLPCVTHEMGKSDSQLRPLNIFRRFFDFIMNSIAVQGFKRVTLGRPIIHGSAEVAVADASQNGSGYMGDYPVGSTKRIKGVDELPSAHENAKWIEVEFQQASDTFDSSTHILEKDSAMVGGNQAQLQEGVHAQLSRPRTIPVEDGGLKIEAQTSKEKEGDKGIVSTTLNAEFHDKEDLPPINNEGVVKVGFPPSQIPEKPALQVIAEQAKVEDKGSKLPVSVPVSEASRPKKTVSFQDDGKITMAIVPKQNEKMKGQRSGRHVYQGNINEKSDAFIRRRKEALRKSSEIEPKENLLRKKISEIEPRTSS